MPNRATLARRNRATPLGPPCAPARPALGVSSRLPSPIASHDLRRAVDRWLADGRTQGWSPRTLHERRQTMNRFAWWLENEAGVAATLDALTRTRLSEFLIYAREARPAAA